LRDGAHGIAVVFLPTDGEVEGAAENSAVLVDGRGGESFFAQCVEERLDLVRLDFPRPPAAEPFPDFGQVVLETTAGLLAVFLPPIVQELLEHHAVVMAGRKVPSLGDLGLSLRE